ncbi:alpha/beta hydrolase fold domain-containing protein [Cellulomonas sp. B6]|uniref:alpha/beta hydrolase fold domain-containing protein n=1 Tax=Cellulomonas sp. B6 TaxID=1295626 RepID=UPI00073BDD01|nr:alpha/beta hydrolase fold domain-containing protein [Cellulomonas sp. B6]KSW30256.1 hypothetical protein ATM99_03680 [Cellulomonas sp. B6]
MRLDPDFVDAPPRRDPSAPPEDFPSATPQERLDTVRRMRGADTGQFGPVPAPGVDRREIEVPTRAGSIRARVYHPQTGVDGPGFVVWVHGGGFVLGDLDTSEHTAAELARTAGLPVVSLHYRRAPEHPYPAAIEDAQDAVRWLTGPDGAAVGVSGPFAVAGDSAGASVSLALCQLATRGECPRPAFALAAYPDVDHVDVRAAAGNQIGLLFERSYLPDDAVRTDPLVSPVLAAPEVLADLPPTLLLIAELDAFREGEEAFAERARAAGAPLSVLTANGMPHGFLDQTWRSPVARRLAVAAFAAVGHGVREAR